ncbi:fimbrial protein [Providencia alcalifaciens]|uniref:fimbrial protein n=1 Tax=Providencia TaxID=586 RepID=UPI0012B5D607|nr:MULTISPECIES: type 1 fimbrial protein [Providencia]MTC48278.1 fimbrial protein [Providencia alcalifaciens]
MRMPKSVIAIALFACASLNANAAATADVTLEGVITATTCDVSVNGDQATLDVGIYRSVDFTANAQLGNVVMPVVLSNCSADETGELLINGITSTGNASQNIFVSNEAETVGFMIADESSVTVANGMGPVVNVTAVDGGTYDFTVGMASTTLLPAAGPYSAPITVAYIVN